MQLLRDLLERIQAVDLGNGVLESEQEIGEGEVVVGEMSDDLKKLYVVMSESHNLLARQCEAAHSRLEGIGTKPKSKATSEELAFVAEHTREHKNHSLIRAIFWHCVKEQFPALIMAEYSIGIRKGGKVVTFKESGSEAEIMFMSLRG